MKETMTESELNDKLMALVKTYYEQHGISVERISFNWLTGFGQPKILYSLDKEVTSQ